MPSQAYKKEGVETIPQKGSRFISINMLSLHINFNICKFAEININRNGRH